MIKAPQKYSRSNLYNSFKNIFRSKINYFNKNESRRYFQMKPFDQIPTVMDLHKKLAIALGKTIWLSDKEKQQVLGLVPSSQDGLPPRSMEDSLIVGKLPFTSNPDLRTFYVGFEHSVRIGRIMEDMDLFAVAVIHKHVLLPNKPDNLPTPYVFVTAKVQNVAMMNDIPTIDHDMRMYGHIVYVGKTSCDIRIVAETSISNKWIEVADATFVMVARTPDMKKSLPINKLVPKNKEEQKLHEEAKKLVKDRAEKGKEEIAKVIPHREELELLHNLYRKRQDLPQHVIKRTIPKNFIWMRNLKLQSGYLMQPVHRNNHNTIFGGYLMRKALELTFMHAMIFCRSRPIFQEMSDITFASPVPINSLALFTAFVGYTYKDVVQIKLIIETINVANMTKSRTNVIHFTYKSKQPICELMPESYNESMLYIDARRHYLDFAKRAEGRQKKL